MRINDRQLKRFVQNLQNGTKNLNDSNVQDLAAAVGDSTARGELRTRQLITGKTRREQFDLVKLGLNATEIEDLKTFLRQAQADGFTLTPKAKNFVEALVGLTPLQEERGFSADSTSIVGNGLTSGSSVTVLNMSDIVDGRQHITEGQVVGTVNEAGEVRSPAITTAGPTGQPRAMDAGDWLRVSVRGSTGEPEWFSVQVGGIDATAPLKANTDRINLAVRSPGVVEVSHNTARPMAEPFAKLRLTNLTTGVTSDFQANEKGSFAPFTVAGEAGQRFEIAISDGVNNRDFADRSLVGLLQVGGGGGHSFDLPDPALHNDDVNGGYTKTRYTGPAIVDGVHYTDPVQGAIGNCYEPAGTSAAAWAVPQALANAIKEIQVVGPDGRPSIKYEVTFYDVDWFGRTTKVTQEVDGDLWVRSSGTPLYGSTRNTPRNPAQMELWYSIREKARAQWKGSYDVTGAGGISGEVTSEVFGRPYSYESVGTFNANQIFEKIRTGISQAAQGRKNFAMSAGTYGHSEEHRYVGRGVYANHAYTITGATEENGVKYVHLRNPWGQSEPAGNGPDDGEFKLTLEDFVYLYQSFCSVDPNAAGPSLDPEVGPMMVVGPEGVIADGPATPFMTTAQKELDQVLGAAEQAPDQPLGGALDAWLVNAHGGGRVVSPSAPTGSVESLGNRSEVDAAIGRMSLEAALQALKDLKRFEQRIGSLADAGRQMGSSATAESTSQELQKLLAKLEAAVARERAAIAANPVQ